MPDDVRTVYVVAVHDAAVDKAVSCCSALSWPVGFSVGEVVARLSAFYTDAANAKIPIRIALSSVYAAFPSDRLHLPHRNYAEDLKTLREAAEAPDDK